MTTHPPADILSHVIDPHPGDVVFDSVSNRRLRGYGAAAGGVAAVVVAVAGFLLSLRTDHGPISFHAMTTVPMIAAVGLFASAAATLRSPTRVILGEQELRVMRGETALGRWRWDELALAPIGQAPISHKRILRLYGEAGAGLVPLRHDPGKFGAVVAAVRLPLGQPPPPERPGGAPAMGGWTGVCRLAGA